MKENSAVHSPKRHAYDKNTRISIPTYDVLIEMVQSYFRAQLEGPASLLVVGAGGGNELAAWGRSNPQWTFTGVDPSEEMLNIAHEKAVELHVADRVRLVEGTIDDLSVSREKFDAASCILVLQFIYDDRAKLESLKKIREQLKPDAPFVLVTAYGEPDSEELQYRLNVWKSFFIDAGFEPAKMDERAEVLRNGISFLPASDIEQLLREAGFVKVTRFYSTGPFGGWICHAK